MVEAAVPEATRDATGDIAAGSTVLGMTTKRRKEARRGRLVSIPFRTTVIRFLVPARRFRISVFGFPIWPSFRPRCTFLFLLATGPLTAVAEDWPGWRGPRRDGTWNESGIVSSFDGPVLAPSWSVPLGPGYTGPTVASGRVYVMDRITEPTERERVLCVDAGTGSKLWERAYDCTYKRIGYPAGPRASVAIDGDRAYALGTMGHLHCFDAASGEVRWKRDLGSELNARIPTWGISATPLVEDDLLIVGVSVPLFEFECHDSSDISKISTIVQFSDIQIYLSLIHISEPTRPTRASRMPSSA